VIKAEQGRPGPPASTAASAKEPCSDVAGAHNRPKDSIKRGTKGRAEETWQQVRYFVPS
jgi:hypothetical protein